MRSLNRWARHAIRLLGTRAMNSFRWRAQLGRGTKIALSVRMVRSGLTLGDNAYVGPQGWLSVPATIGSHTMLAPRVGFVGGDHDWDQIGTPIRSTMPPGKQPISIGQDVWLGYGVIVMHGVTIGDGTIVGAGSVVTHDIPPNCLAVGVPARVIRQRMPDSDFALHMAKLHEIGG